MHVVVVVGARPQFIKAAPVSRALAAHPGVSEAIVHTGQHFDPEMSETFFRELEIPEPKYNLGIHGGGHGAMTGRMLEALSRSFRRSGSTRCWSTAIPTPPWPGRWRHPS